MERVRDLEGRAEKASQERREIVKELGEIKVSIAKWTIVLAIALAGVQFLAAHIMRVAS